MAAEQEPAVAFAKAVRDWHIHGFASVKRWADEIGYRVAMHSRESAAAKSGMTQSDRKWSTYYAPIIKRFGLREEQVKGYPARICVGDAPALDVAAPAGQSSPQAEPSAADTHRVKGERDRPRHARAGGLQPGPGSD